MKAKAGPAFLVALLLGVVAPAKPGDEWYQLAGGPGREGVALLAGAPLDVIATSRVLAEGEAVNAGLALGFVETPGGIAAVARDGDGACLLVGFEVQRAVGAPSRLPLDACRIVPFDPLSGLTAYDPRRDALLVCTEGLEDPPGGSAILQSRNRVDGHVKWSIRPLPDLGIDPSAATLDWACSGTNLDEDLATATVAFVGLPRASAGALVFSPPTAHRIARINLETGAVQWSTSVPSPALLTGRPEARGLGAAAHSEFLPLGLTLTSTGIVASGFMTACGSCAPSQVFPVCCPEGAAAWLTPNGTLVGGALAATDARAAPRTGAILTGSQYGSYWAAASGPLAAYAAGGRLLLVNPLERDPVAAVPLEAIESSAYYFVVTAPKWWEDHLVVPLSHSVMSFSPATLEKRWAWTDGPEWDVSTALIVPPTDLYLAIGRSRTGEFAAPGEGVVLRLDLESGRVVTRLPLPFETFFGYGRWYAQLLPLRDGTVLLGDDKGNVAVLGPADADAKPRLSLSTAFPGPGEPVTLSVEPGPGLAAGRFLVSWGDTAPEEVGSNGTASHRYAEGGPRTIRVTGYAANGRTATAEALVRVGATPPPDLNFLQTAFAPENQDLTFGLLGLLATAAGGAIALASRSRRRRRLRGEIEALERIRDRGRSDPHGALRALSAYRAGLLRDLTLGRLDERVYQSADARARDLLGMLTARVLGPLADRLSPSLRDLLEATLLDGRVDAEEASRLEEALRTERGLAAEDRESLARLFNAWRSA